jgi:hypothetical protein
MSEIRAYGEIEWRWMQEVKGRCEGNTEVEACWCILALKPVNLITGCNSYYC